MWREGFSFALIGWLLNALALAFGVLLGVRGLLDPNWAAKLVRLKPDEQGGGFAEFRATFGGLFLAAHGVALFFSLNWIFGGAPVIGLFAAGAASVLCAAWAGTAGGRALSMLRDKTWTQFNLISVGVELFVAALIGAPWAFWSVSSPG